MNRILTFIITLCLAWTVGAAESFAAEERLIAVIMTNSQPRYQDIHAVFTRYAQSFCRDDCRIYVQTPNEDVMSLRNSVRKAAALDADLIVTYGTSAALAAKAEAPLVPTIFADVYDPIRLGLVSEKTKSSRNMTGIRGDAPVQALFKYFADATGAKKLAVLFDAKSNEGRLQKSALEESAGKRGVVVLPLEADTPKDHLSMMRALPKDVDGLFLGSSEHTDDELLPLIKLADSRHLPLITQRPGTADLGAFMVLETSADEQGEKLAEIAGRFFAGEKTVEITLYKPHQVEFIVNIKVAKDYGIQVPFQTLSVATRILR